MTNRRYAADFACNTVLSESFVGVGIGKDLTFKTRQGPNMSEIISSKLACTNNSFCNTVLSESFVGVGIGKDLRFKTRQGPNMSEIISSKQACTNNSFCDKNRSIIVSLF